VWLAAALGGAPASAAERVTVGGGPIGGTFYVVASGFAKILTEDAGYSASVEVSNGSTHNVQLVDAGQTDFGITNASVFYAGMNGDGWAKGKKYENCRLLFGMQLSYIHFWTLKSTGLRNLDGLNRRIVNLSAKGSGADVTGRKILALLDIKPAKITNVGHNDANQMMQDGLVHAALTAGGLPHPAVAALAATHDIAVFGVGDRQGDVFLKANPALSRATLPKGTYRGVDYDVPTVGDWNILLVNKNLPDDKVYQIMKLTFAKIDKWIAVHASAKETKPENIKGLTQYPIHPGALRYYKEKGIL
jgi:hypothetical protein